MVAPVTVERIHLSDIIFLYLEFYFHCSQIYRTNVLNNFDLVITFDLFLLLVLMWLVVPDVAGCILFWYFCYGFIWGRRSLPLLYPWPLNKNLRSVLHFVLKLTSNLPNYFSTLPLLDKIKSR